MMKGWAQTRVVSRTPQEADTQNGVRSLCRGRTVSYWHRKSKRDCPKAVTYTVVLRTMTRAEQGLNLSDRSDGLS